ncbi:putative mixed-linked glucan synthase 7 [Nymphaea thermarum]|nr:putative mixed-linked glucan synthase 7 [Nymphaea thermarum]
MKGSGGLPLQERVEHPNTVERLFLCIHSVLILCLLLYRLAVLPELPGGVAFGVWLAALLCECWFAFIWVLSLNCKWHFIEHKTFPDRLLQRFKSSEQFPAMDVFVTTADPVMEPPINTVLSILAVDYPASKIACYLSDDGCSPITFFSLIEASKFAHSWVPFCKKYGLECRAPFNYFSLSQTGDAHDPSSAFHQDWKETKGAYEELVKKIAEVAKKSIPDKFSGDEFSDFARVEKRNHPSIVKIINEHKGRQDDQVPHLIYVSREKRPSHAHHFKAGAMNVLVLDKQGTCLPEPRRLGPDPSRFPADPFERVSGVMTNAPFMLNLDCDMFMNNPKTLYHALCLLLGFGASHRTSISCQVTMHIKGLRISAQAVSIEEKSLTVSNHQITRVAGVMTSAPFTLNLDCDMFVDNPVPCPVLLGFESETQSGFVQFSQTFHGALKDDPYGNQLKVFKSSQEFPAMDVFVTTADAVMEPPIITVNPVLSILAVDYPASKIACYVSDDGCSPITFFSLMEASKFAHSWVPFCKKYGVECRAPFKYFSQSQTDHNPSSTFYQEWKEMKIINEHRGREDDQVPHLIYVSREKRPSHAHHFKAGAMNVLTRVSGVMTSAPFMLNLDCDMFVNNPKVLYQALCLLLGFESEVQSGFVQFPQIFHGALKDDPYGNQLKVLLKGAKMGEALAAIFGRNQPLIESALGAASEVRALVDPSPSQTLSSSLEAAIAVSACDYEDNTLWGKQVGWDYGSTSEDVMTGCRIHSSGWNSVLCFPDQPAFLGAAPSNGPDSLVQQKRWATGLLQILITRRNPLRATVREKLQLRQCMVYLSVLLWAARSVPEFCYAILPALCIFTDTSIFPKRAYEELAKKIAEAARKSIPDEFSGEEFSDFSQVEKRNHPSIVKTRVSGVMTSAPFMLNLDCDMFVNNPKALYQALCLLLGFESEVQSGFVQFPQIFHGALKDDPYGNQLKVFLKHLMPGSNACQGPMYGGTCCFHRRKVIYGQQPSERPQAKNGPHNYQLANGHQNGRCGMEEALAAIFGHNQPLIESALGAASEVRALVDPSPSQTLSSSLGAAFAVSACDYEDNTLWGKQGAYEKLAKKIPEAAKKSISDKFSGEQFSDFARVEKRNHPSIVKIINEHKGRQDDQVPRLIYVSREKRPSHAHHFKAGVMNVLIGWDYGSTAEDVMTGCRIHSSGWNSVACLPDPPAFLGAAPSTGPDTMVQQKRWATGLLETLIGRRNPVKAIVREKLQLRQCMVYLILLLWAVRSVPELCYAILPALCIFTNTSIFPKITDPEFRLPAAIFIIFNLYILVEYLLCGLSVREWWNNQRMARIVSSTAWLFGLLAVLLKVFGISETVFELTRKDDLEGASTEAGKFIFDSSAIYVPATTLLFVNLAALALGLTKVVMDMEATANVGELVCCAWVVMSFLPFVKGLFRRGQHGIPWPTICKAGTVTFMFVCLCRWFAN